MAYAGAMPADASGAPPFMGATPPDRVQMSLEQHCDGLLASLAQAPPTPEQAQYLNATFQQAEQMLRAYQSGQPVGAPQTGENDQQDPNQPPAAQPGGQPDTTRDFGDDPSNVPYGGQ